MKKKHIQILLTMLIVMLVLLSAMAFSQDTAKAIQTEVSLHINTRYSKIDTCFDYYFSAGSKTVIKKFVIIDLSGSYEREHGVIYLSHSEKASCKYGQVGYMYDTGKEIKVFYASVYYTFLKILKAGYDFSIDQDANHSIYLGFKWRFVNAEIVFLEDLRRFKYLFDPTMWKGKKWEKISLKLKIEGFYVPGKFRWTNGLTLSYKIS